MTDKESKLPAHLRPPYEKPRSQSAPYRDRTGNTAAGNVDRETKTKTWGPVWR